MSTSGITSSLLSLITSSPSTANQLASDLNQMASDLQSGSLSAAQEDYVTLSADALNGATNSAATTASSGISTSLLSNIASSPSTSYSFISELNQVGSDLENNDLSSAQGDMLTLSATALNTAASSSNSSTSSLGSISSGQSVSAADVQTDIRAMMLAVSSGDSSDATSEMEQLSSDAQNLSGTNYFKLISVNSSSTPTSSTASTSDSVSTLLQSLDPTQTNVNSLLSSSIIGNS